MEVLRGQVPTVTIEITTTELLENALSFIGKTIASEFKAGNPSPNQQTGEWEKHLVTVCQSITSEDEFRIRDCFARGFTGNMIGIAGMEALDNPHGDQWITIIVKRRNGTTLMVQHHHINF